MFRCLWVTFFVIFAVCSFREKDSRSLGRHAWRCGEKLKNGETEESAGESNEGSQNKAPCHVQQMTLAIAAIGATVLKLNADVEKPVTVLVV